MEPCNVRLCRVYKRIFYLLYLFTYIDAADIRELRESVDKENIEALQRKAQEKEKGVDGERGDKKR